MFVPDDGYMRLRGYRMRSLRRRGIDPTKVFTLLLVLAAAAVVLLILIAVRA